MSEFNRYSSWWAGSVTSCSEMHSLKEICFLYRNRLFLSNLCTILAGRIHSESAHPVAFFSSFLQLLIEEMSVWWQCQVRVRAYIQLAAAMAVNFVTSLRICSSLLHSCHISLFCGLIPWLATWYWRYPPTLTCRHVTTRGGPSAFYHRDLPPAHVKRPSSSIYSTIYKFIIGAESVYIKKELIIAIQRLHEMFESREILDNCLYLKRKITLKKINNKYTKSDSW